MKLVTWTTLLLTASACGGEGTIEVTAYGEEFIEQGIVASATDDAWSVSYERFDVTIRNAMVAGVAVDDVDPVDLTQPSDGGGQRLGEITVADGDYRDASFDINALDIVGAISKGSETKTFAWHFDQRTHYDHCDAITKVEAGGRSTFQITVHADHFFYDSLVSLEPRLLVQPIADADMNNDDVIEPSELQQTDIGPYDPGNENIDDLWHWLIAASRGIGHVNGEGHCHAAASE